MREQARVLLQAGFVQTNGLRLKVLIEAKSGLGACRFLCAWLGWAKARRGQVGHALLYVP